MPIPKKIINYNGLYGDNDLPFLPDFLHCELLETRSGSYNWEIKQHIHTQLCQVFLIEAGECLIHTGNEPTQLHTPCLLLIPENTLHGFHFSSDSKGIVVTFSASLLEKQFENAPHILLALSKFQVLEAREHSRYIIQNIIKEFHAYLPERGMAIASWLGLLFVDIFRFSGIEKGNNAPIDRNLAYFQQYQRLIRQFVISPKTISQYAAELNITPVHLNRVCQAVVEKSSSQVLQDYMITEAERYLKYTSYSISEIAYLLRFENPCYFTRLFKKNVGVSPKAFREK
jgi:AraC family transcriptional regulator, transcriptional activator of pobA